MELLSDFLCIDYGRLEIRSYLFFDMGDHVEKLYEYIEFFMVNRKLPYFLDVSLVLFKQVNCRKPKLFVFH